MARISHSFSTDAAASTVWERLSAIERIGGLLPHVQSVRPGDAANTWVWSIKGSVGPITKTFNVKVAIEEAPGEGKLGFKGDGDGLAITGSISVTPLPPDKSRISVDMEIDPGRGVVAAVVNNFLKNNLPSDIEEAERKIRGYVEADDPQTNAQP